jgi:hypothetical protein
MTINRKRIIVVSLLVVFHLTARLVNLSGDGSDNTIWKSFQMSLVASQLSLIAIWGSVSKTKSFFRIPLTLVLLVSCFFISPIGHSSVHEPCNMDDDSATNEPTTNDSTVNEPTVNEPTVNEPTVNESNAIESNATDNETVDTENPLGTVVADGFLDVLIWLVFGIYLSQILIVVCVIHALKLGKWGYLLWKNGLSPEFTSSTQFSIRFLLIWMTILALMLGLGKLACDYFGFTSDKLILAIRSVGAGAIYGFFSAAYALIPLALIFSRRPLLKKTIISVLALEGFCSIQAYVVVKSSDVILASNLQILILFATLLPLRWCGLLGQNQPADSK